MVQLRLGTVSDQIVSNATGSLAGLLSVALQPGFVPTAGATFDVFSFSSRTGTFSQILGSGQDYTPTYTATGLTLTAVATVSADLAITKTDSPDPVDHGATLTYTITVTNNGPDAAADVTVIDQVTRWRIVHLGHNEPGIVRRTSGRDLHAGDAGQRRQCDSDHQRHTHWIRRPREQRIRYVHDHGPEPVQQSATTTTIVAGSATTFTVTTTADSGIGSLRQAILDANASVGTVDRIHFGIPGTGVHTISPASFLPAISDPVVIDGTTQPGTAGTPLIELDGTNAGPQTSGLFITAGGTTIRGLTINRFGTGGTVNSSGGAGIILQGGGNNVIEGNVIGMDPATSLEPGNRTDGVFVDNSPNNRIGGTGFLSRNVISGNGRFGITLSGAGTTGTLVQGNFIGLDSNGEDAEGPQGNGVVISGANGTTIGGTASAAANWIAFNGLNGIEVASGSGNAILGNRIFSNGALGINLGPAGSTPNDPGDADTGPNGLQNFPLLSMVTGGVKARTEQHVEHRVPCRVLLQYRV